MLACCELRDFSSSDVTGFFRPVLYFLTYTVLKVTAMGGRYLDFLKNICCKNISRRRFSIPVNAYPMFFGMR